MRKVKRFLNAIKKFFLILYLLGIHALAMLFAYEKFVKPYFDAQHAEVAQVGDPTEQTPVPTILPIPSIEPQPTPAPIENDVNQSTDSGVNQSIGSSPPADSSALMIPVVGIRREQLQDTFNDSRSEGRVHNAMDIMAPLGTPVVAVADGEIAKFFDSERGGITIYQYSRDRRYVYYYAHLQKRADNLKEKDFVRRGTIIGYVGDTGNSGAGNYHLHFTVTSIAEGQSIFEGTDVNPYPLLKNGIESR
jgi:murein DD-endopeptidase MepM/ murein hydrolase activator NlpD